MKDPAPPLPDPDAGPDRPRHGVAPGISPLPSRPGDETARDGARAFAPRTASCACGALQLTVSAPPLDCHACACTLCQRASGSVMTVSAYFDAAAVTVTGPWARFHHKGHDREDRWRAFCPSCGGTVFFKPDARPGVVAVPAGGFADPEFPVPDFLIHWADRPRWIGTPLDVPVWEADCPEG